MVAVDNALTFVMWVKNFLEWQAKDLLDNSKMKNVGKNVIIEQDNTSAIQLERNGVRSSTKRTKHINCCYFYITERIRKGDASVVHKSTELMWSDYHTKG